MFGSEAWAHIPDEKGKPYSLRVRNLFLLDTLKMLRVIELFNQIQYK